MNRLLFIMMLLPAGSAMAQSFSKTPVVLKADTIKPNLKALLEPGTVVTPFLQQGRPSHTTSQGTIYVMPPDNMPCLVPDKRKTVAIPTQPMRLYKGMPNGITLPRQKLNKE